MTQKRREQPILIGVTAPEAGSMHFERASFRNERLYPVWIRNLQSDPLTLPIGIGPSNASTGAMIRGGFKARPQFDINCTLYFSTLVATTPVDSDRFAGGRAGIFVPKARLEVGGSFQHLLQQGRSNLFGFRAIWQPMAMPLDIRWEFACSKRGSGYWLEPAYKLSQLPFWQNEMRRTQLVARYPQFCARFCVKERVGRYML